MGIKLSKLKNLCEQYLESDYLMSVVSATQLMERFGL